MAPNNRAAWLPSKKAPAYVIKEAPYISAPPGMIVIKTAAVAINPIDWMIPKSGDIMYTWLKYPCIMGFDVAGEVVEVGTGVTRFKPGDRVLGCPIGTNENVNDASQGGFQKYVVLNPAMTSHIPANLPYEKACVIPLGLTTAICGLFQADQLALELPTPSVTPRNETLIIWGGSTSVGCNAIQIAVAAGYEVFTTCSPKNFDLVKRLGASRVWDYNSPNVIKDMITALKDKSCAGAFTVGAGAADACMDILAAAKGNKFISMATYPMPKTEPQSFVKMRTAYGFVSWIASYKLKGLRYGVKSNFIFGSTVADNGIGEKIFGAWLEAALREGRFVAEPEAVIVGKGLEDVWKGCEIHKKGVSARKLVVTL